MLGANFFFKTSPLPPPSGKTGLALLETISQLFTKAGATVNPGRCEMIAKHHIAVICKKTQVQRVELVDAAIADGWRYEGKSPFPGFANALIFSRNRDSLTMEIDDKEFVRVISIRRKFS
ncbi:hypothetical protein [Variovorax sp. JS1663]|uniref:hypothetical protein n=1 Tax=Variovorax sp. JS1663 TaxID=1851577 RepID=UPI00117FE5E8|nr:hypothetical protein [Variovorax sp. JS1663]